MKKFLILLLITLPSFAFCQAVITLSFCNGGGIIESSVFTTWQPDYNPDTHLVTLHNTYVDAAENLNGIPSSTVITASQTKFVRILNLQTGEVSIGTIIVIVNPPMEVSLAATLDSPTSSVMCYTFGGTPPYYFQWSIDGVIQTEGDTSMILIPTSNAVSEISCVVTDSSTNPCQAMASIQITPYTPINADALSILVDDTEIVTSTASVFYNDYLNYQSLTFPAIQQQVYLEETGEGWDNFNLNASGTISALPGTPAGTYNLQYSVFHVNGGFVGSASINLQVFSSAVQLIAFVDWDGNGIKSDDEPLFVEGKFLISGSDGTELELYSDTGTYVYNTLSNITYGLSYQVNDGSLPVFSCGTSFLDINPIAGSTTTYFFPINSTPAINGVVSLVSYQTPSPGFTRYYEVKVKNIGSLPIVNAVLNVQKPDYSTLVSYCNTCIATAEGFQKSNITLAPFEQAVLPFAVQFNTIPNIQLGDYVTTTATFVAENDVNPTDNISNLTQMVMGSYDPNGISEKHRPEVVLATWPTGEELEYTIRFENTGNGPAETVRLENTLPTNVDALSFTPIDASHRYQLQQNGNQITVVFNNIDLPPSNGSETVGNGFVTYRVKPTAGFDVGTEIQDAAEIYFDFNPAIITPTWNTKFVEQLSVPRKEKLIQFYTNPVTDVFELTLTNNNAMATAAVYDLTGSLLATAKSKDGKLLVDTQNWSSGIYLLKLQSGEEIEHIKLLKR